MTSKKCCRCLLDKEGSQFYKKKDATDGLHPACKECVKERNKKWYAENSCNKKVKSKKYRLENIEKVKEKKRVSYSINREKALTQMRAYREKNKDKHNESSRIYYQENSAKLKLYQINYRSTNRVKRASSLLKSQEKRKAVMADGMSHYQFQKWVEAQDKICFYCSVDCSDGYHVDHFIPISKGGLHTADNLRVACVYCNLSKHDSLPRDFIRRMNKKTTA